MRQIIKALWIALGFISLALGLLGAFLPLLPTTPFLLMSVWAFTKSSPRLHRWLLEHPRFGPAIRQWQQHGAISRRGKLLAMLAIGGTVIASLLLGIEGRLLAVQLVVLACASAFILSRPSGPRTEPRRRR